MTKKITPKQYATISGMKSSTISRRIREGRDLPNVTKVENFGRFYILTYKDDT